MKNEFVEKMKTVLSSYHQLMKVRNAEIEANNEKYSPQHAEQLNAEVRKKKQQDYEDAKNEIQKIFEEVRTLIACSAEWNTDSEDFKTVRELMSSGIDFTEQEINSLLQKYQNDFTIVRMIGDTVKKNNPPLYDKLEIRTPLSAVEAYRQFGQSALYIAEKINQNHWSADLSLQNFDDPTINARLYETIGSGDSLKKFDYTNIPISAMHDFDNITL